MNRFETALRRYRAEHDGKIGFMEDNPPANLHELLQHLESLSVSEQISAAHFLGSLKSRTAIPKLLILLRRTQSRVGILIAQCESIVESISNIGGDRAYTGMLDLLSECKSAYVREAAVHGIGMMFEVRALPVLLKIFIDPSESADTRARAAEGLAHPLRFGDRRTKRWRSAMRALLAGLDDPDVEVRIWSVFALGEARVLMALPKLRILAESDTAISRSMKWTVGEEAKDAIYSIRHGKWPSPDAYERMCGQIQSCPPAHFERLR